MIPSSESATHDGAALVCSAATLSVGDDVSDYTTTCSGGTSTDDTFDDFNTATLLQRDDHCEKFIRQYGPRVHVERHLERKGGIVGHFPIRCLTIRYGPLVEQKKSMPQG